MRNLYNTCGTTTGFFSAVFDAYTDKRAVLVSDILLQAQMGDEWINFTVDEQKARRVIKKLRAVDKQCLYEIDRILRSNQTDKEQIAFLYIRLIVKNAKAVRQMQANADVQRALDVVKAVGNETHRLKGFLRFNETMGGVFYAPCSPDHDIIELLMPHFIERFQRTAFIIHDVKREKAGIYNGESFLITKAGKADVVLTQTEQDVQSLWKKYYESVNIPVRKNVRQQKGYMPVRYWKFLNEMQGEK